MKESYVLHSNSTITDLVNGFAYVLRAVRAPGVFAMRLDLTPGATRNGVPHDLRVVVHLSDLRTVAFDYSDRTVWDDLVTNNKRSGLYGVAQYDFTKE